ncbi:hypothetical protein DYB32_002785 [Aphanomyces invadans]|uniref:Uncharacterized protein n=1 Tax=Aphanomyces invadans TaxID=157072 RepID=A0A418B2B7_9STRA|nr:hypothetical protein DYB32_002785 [Aphanomyces invadans]
MGGGTKQGHQRRDDDAGGRGGRGGRVGKQREVEPSISLPFVLWRKDGFRAGSERYDMAAFVKAAAACDTDVNELILQTGNTPVVMDKLRQILRFGFKVSTHTFQDIALPLMALVASDKFVLSPHTTDVKNILRAIHSEPLFFMRVRNCIEGETAALMAAGLFDRAVTCFAAVLNLIVQKIPNAALDDDMFNQAKTLLEWLVLHHNSDGVRLALASLRDTVELCMELVPSRRPVERDAARPNYLIGLGRTFLGQQYKADDPAGAPAFDLGPRHDNDFADFRQVQVIPTDLEMRCLEPSYLPHCLAPNAGMEAHLEVHFRLLREDVLAQIKRGVQWLLDPQTLHRCVATGKWLPPREENVPRLNVATDARLDKVKGSIRKGIMFVIKAKQPLGRQGVRPKDLKAFWEREQRYKVGSLVCIACNVHLDHGPAHEGHADGGFPRYAGLAAESLVFATVCESNLVDLTSSEDDFSISVRICDTSKTADHIAALSNSRAQNLLVEVRGLFFPSYEPVLRALQAHNTRTLRKELQEGLFGSGTAEPAWKAKPAYVSRLDAYNLQFLVKAAFRQRVDLSRVPIVDFEQLAGVLRPLETEGCLTLDGSQVDAFAAALTQQVCLIQGPPGTGKSYVGTKIVHAIVQQRGLQVGPLLCVCYTNHALDQFLEDLVKDGLRVTSIVRIGAYSKSEMLQKRSLQLLEQVNLSSRQENIRYGQLHRQCRDIETSFLDQLGTTPGGPTVSLMQWVQTYVSDEFASIVGSVDGDGFAAQGQSNKDHKARWKAWKKGEAKPNAGGMWAMSAQQRRDQIATWRAALEAFDKRNMSTQLDEYERCVAEADQVSNAKSLRLLKTANVVGITTTGAAKYHALLRALAPTVVVCEEAGEVLEAHLLSCLTSATQHVIQIGDHQQLRPILNEHILTHEAKRGYDLDVSLFERLVHERKDGASSDAAVPGSLVTLHVQRRMRPEICDLIRWTLYPRLCDGPNVVAYPATTRGFTHNLWFIDHDHGENTNDLSCKNSFEAELVVELVAHAVRQGYGLEDMTILTPYLGQLVLIRSYLSGKNFRVALEDKDVEAMRAADMDDDADDERLVGRPASKVAVQSLREFVRLSTVDNFQGNESPLVFISTVRNNDSGRTGFLKTFNRVNVMLSRARHAMYVLGSVSTIRRCAKAKMFNGVLDILQDKERIGRTIGLRCQNHGTITQVASASDIRQLSPDGGCLRPCDRRLNCGHTCVKMCHADDPRHMAVQCMEPCVKRVTVCGHLCIARCYESQVVDLIMGTMLADHDPDESPLVRLRCGHCFTIETMDGCMDLAAFYTRNAVGEWVSPTPLKAPSQGGAQYACPTCRAPVGGVHRYGRLINFSNVMLSELKYFHVVTDEIARAQAMRASGSADDLSNKVVQLRRFVAAETPTQEMWTKESSRLARLGCAGDSLNLNAYRHVMTSQTRIMLGLELLELLVLRLHVLKKTLLTSETFAAQLRADYDDGCKLEESLRQTCLQASSHRSANDVLLVGMKLRLAFYKQAVSNGMKVSKNALLQELRQSLRALQTSAHPVAAATLELAQDLVTVAENVGTLSKDEKDAIFKVFATGQDVYAHGFGGHWSACSMTCGRF